MPLPVFDSSSGKRAKGKTPELEAILQELESFADYDADVGGFIIHRQRRTGKEVGQQAGTFNKVLGYRMLALKPENKAKTNYYVHRLVWLWHTGSWPSKRIDHINQDRTDNRIENLRDVSDAINGRNQRRSSANTSGYPNVYQDKRDGCWYVKIKVNQKSYNKGWFKTFEEAVEAREELIAAHPEWAFTSSHGFNKPSDEEKKAPRYNQQPKARNKTNQPNSKLRITL